MLEVHTSFIRTPFYKEDARVNLPQDDASLLNGKLPLFWYDMQLDEQIHPWIRVEHLPMLFKRWHDLDIELSFYHEQEDKQEVAIRTPEFTALVIQAFFWINHQRVPKLNQVEQYVPNLKNIPPNGKDRLAFVLIAPQRYRSYIQMKSLMEELEKLYARVRVMEAKSKK